MLTAALTFLIVHPTIWTTSQAHVDEQGIGEHAIKTNKWVQNGRIRSPIRDGTEHNAIVYYPSNDCSGEHDHAQEYQFNLGLSARNLVKEGWYSSRELTFRSAEWGKAGRPSIQDDFISEYACTNECQFIADSYFECVQIAGGLSAAAAAAGIIGSVSWKVAPVASAVAGGAAMITTFVAWLVNNRCKKMRPEPGFCPKEEHAIWQSDQE